MKRKKVIVFGAGLTGLAAARYLANQGHEVEVYEAADHVGGLASTFKDNLGFVYDNGPRFIFSTLAEKVGIADICEPVKYLEHLRVGSRDYLFPFGFIRNPLFCMSVGLSMVTRLFKPKPKNLGQFLRTYYGSYFARKVLSPLIEKWSGVDVDQMSIDFASRLLPTNLSYIIYQVIRKIRGGITEDYYKGGRYIVYPKGSNAKIFEKLMEAKNFAVELNAPVEKAYTEGNLVRSVQIHGTQKEADYYLSTIPVTNLAEMLQGDELKELRELSYRGIIVLFIKLNRENVLDGLWTWFPEKKYSFYRISEYKNAIDGMAPQGKTLISIEMALEKDDPRWEQSADEIYTGIEKDLNDLYGLEKDQILGLDAKQSRYAYPVLKMKTEEKQRSLTHQTPLKNLFIAGRTGNFQYKMTEGSFDSAISCADLILSKMEGRPPTESENTEPERDAYGRPLVVHE